ncbi:MAG: hypothetical protein ACJ8C4_13860 [Gemmataceae bacterium]
MRGQRQRRAPPHAEYHRPVQAGTPLHQILQLIARRIAQRCLAPPSSKVVDSPPR